MMISEKMKQRFKELVEPMNMTKWKCAATLGISYQTYLDIYKYGKVPGLRQMIRIADYFGVSLDYLLGRTDKTK